MPYGYRCVLREGDGREFSAGRLYPVVGHAGMNDVILSDEGRPTAINPGEANVDLGLEASGEGQYESRVAIFRAEGRPRFNSGYTLCVSIEHNHPQGDDVTPEMMRRAVLEKANELDKADAWGQAMDGPDDTVENQADT